MRFINILSVAFAAVLYQSPFAAAAPAPDSGDHSGSSCYSVLSTLQNNLAGPLGQLTTLAPQNATTSNMAGPFSNITALLNNAASQIGLLGGSSSGVATPSASNDPSTTQTLQLFGIIILDLTTAMNHVISVTVDLNSLLNLLKSIGFTVAVNGFSTAITVYANLSLVQILVYLPNSLLTILGDILTMNSILGLSVCLTA